MHSKPPPACIFCGAKADSREHAIPKWISKRLGLRGMMYPTLVERAQPRRHPISFASHRERIFCAGCNRHFKDLEDEAVDLITWMAKGRAATLGRMEQAVLARWGAKTGYALLAAERDTRHAVPIEHRRMLRDQDIVHPNTWVAYRSWRGQVHKVTMGDGLIDATYEGGPQGLRTYRATLTFGQLALGIFGVADLIPEGLVLGWYDVIGQVAPALERDLVWPMMPPAQDENLRTMVEWVPLRRVPRPLIAP